MSNLFVVHTFKTSTLSSVSANIAANVSSTPFYAHSPWHLLQLILRSPGRISKQLLRLLLRSHGSISKYMMHSQCNDHQVNIVCNSKVHWACLMQSSLGAEGA